MKHNLKYYLDYIGYGYIFGLLFLPIYGVISFVPSMLMGMDSHLALTTAVIIAVPTYLFMPLACCVGVFLTDLVVIPVFEKVEQKIRSPR